MRLARILVALLLVAHTAFVAGADRDRLLESHRRLVVLLDAAQPDAPGTPSAATRAGLAIAHEAQAHRARLDAQLLEQLARWQAAPSATAPDELTRFLDFVERDPTLRDGDKLAFLDTLAELRAAVIGDDPSLVAFRARLDADLAALATVRERYDRELGEIRARVGLRSMSLRRERWEDYVAFLRKSYRAEDILRDYAAHAADDADHRSGETLPKPAPRANEINGLGLPPKTLVLTFDDGPHPRYTDRILEILARYDAPAIFFQVGRNLGALGPNGAATLNRGAEIARRIVAAGHAIANHSYSHPHLPSLAPASANREIDDTQALLAAASPAAAPMFRAPYGARNASVLAELGIRNLQSVMWNIDSRDWADPVPASIAQRVIDSVSQQGRGIVLFHDIHERTVDALPLVLDALTREGYRFAGWDGKTFVVKDSAKRGATQVVRATPAPEPLYRESFAVIIGIDDYARWPKLRHAVADALGMKEVLVRRYGFKPANVFTLTNAEATRERIMSLLGETLADPKRVQRDDRVLVFFAGHGATRRLASGRDLGYIVPVEASADRFHGQAISMSEFQDIVEAIPAKHILFLMDSCYSGLALTRSAGLAERSSNYLREISRRTSRQMLTAGGANQQVADGGPNGHSIFTWTLLQALEGKADANGDGVITTSELAAHVGPIVSSLSNQTPAFGNMPGSEGGEFVFELAPTDEYLSAQSRQLDDEAIRLNAAIERLRAETAAKERRNEALRAELARAEAAARGEALPPTKPESATPPDAPRLNDLGTALFRERRYDEALVKFREALRADPAYALAANNLGFTYFKLDRLPESVEWFERTIAIDPRRAVAYLNLGDALAQLKRREKARAAYLKYLELAPTGRAAPHVQAQLLALES